MYINVPHPLCPNAQYCAHHLNHPNSPNTLNRTSPLPALSPPKHVMAGDSYSATTNPRSRRAIRHTRKKELASSAARLNASNTDTAICEETTGTPSDPEATLLYKCFCCEDEFPIGEGIITCAVHLICKSCILVGAHLALVDPECFPIKCCRPVGHLHIEKVLTPKQMDLYAYKTLEYDTPRSLRVYCSSRRCQRFIPAHYHNNSNHWHSIARCECGVGTCVICKSRFKDEHHRCGNSDPAHGRPNGLPENTPDCRIKLCPDCRTPIEHKEACNHMICGRCHHEFCFICMLPWIGFHGDAGCPHYGDPAVGYDDEGFECSTCGIHRDTGYDRHGLNRLGHDRSGLPAIQ